jgi:hypothetical protein
VLCCLGLCLGLFDIVYLAVLTVALVGGILFGYLLRNRKRASLDRVSFGVILLLIFSLGFSIGGDKALLGSLPKVGFNAVVILLFALTFSVVFVKVARRLVRVQ